VSSLGAQSSFNSAPPAVMMTSEETLAAVAASKLYVDYFDNELNSFLISEVHGRLSVLSALDPRLRSRLEATKTTLRDALKVAEGCVFCDFKNKNKNFTSLILIFNFFIISRIGFVRRRSYSCLVCW
jgi:hypothetical protein